MSDFDDDLARRRADLQEERARAATSEQRADEANMQAAAVLVNELTDSFRTERLRFSVVQPGDYEDVEDEVDIIDGDANPYRVAVWCRDFDDTVGYVVIHAEYHEFRPNWENEAIEYFTEFSSEFRPDFIAHLRNELINGLANYLDAHEGD